MKKLLLIALLMFGAMNVATPEAKASPQLIQAYLSMAAQYEQAASRLTGNERQRYLELASLYRQYAAQLGGGNVNRPPSTPPRPEKPQGLTREEIMRRAMQSRQAAMNFLRRNPPGRNGGYLIWFSRPPIYQGDTRYTPSPRPHFATAATVVREITRLTNNGNQITGMRSH